MNDSAGQQGGCYAEADQWISYADLLNRMTAPLDELERRWLWQASFSAQKEATEKAVGRILSHRMTALASQWGRAQ